MGKGKRLRPLDERLSRIEEQARAGNSTYVGYVCCDLGQRRIGWWSRRRAIPRLNVVLQEHRSDPKIVEPIACLIRKWGGVPITDRNLVTRPVSLNSIGR